MLRVRRDWVEGVDSNDATSMHLIQSTKKQNRSMMEGPGIGEPLVITYPHPNA